MTTVFDEITKQHIQDVGIQLRYAIQRFSDLGEMVTERTFLEYEMYCYLLINTIASHVEAIITLSNTNLSLLPTAMVASRTIFELSLRTQWILQPEDKFEREVRWFTHARDSNEKYGKMIGVLDKGGSDSTDNQKDYQASDKYFEDMEKSLQTAKPGIKIPRTAPNFREIAKALNEERQYGHYVIMSQYGHGGRKALKIFIREVDGKMKKGNYISPSDWRYCFFTCYFGLMLPGAMYFARMGVHPDQFMPPHFRDQLLKKIELIAHDKD